MTVFQTSGGDQWSADVFHTRDMVRQAVVDWMQMVRSLKACGDGTMQQDDGTEQLSCDWNDDGVIDLESDLMHSTSSWVVRWAA